jgi:hypothetical protein
MLDPFLVPLLTPVVTELTHWVFYFKYGFINLMITNNYVLDCSMSVMNHKSCLFCLLPSFHTGINHSVHKVRTLLLCSVSPTRSAHNLLANSQLTIKAAVCPYISIVLHSREIHADRPDVSVARMPSKKTSRNVWGWVTQHMTIWAAGSNLKPL